MSRKLSIDLSKFRAAGVYTIENDFTESPIITTQDLRLLVGFNPSGPFNTPIFFKNEAEVDKILGPIDGKLEKRGCYFNRFARTLLQSTPIFALNLLKTDINDKSDFCSIPTKPFAEDDKFIASIQPKKATYADYFDRSRFWHASSDKLQNIVKQNMTGTNVEAPLLSFANCGTKDVSFIVLKPSHLTGYGLTAREWYGSIEEIPYEWIDPDTLISDYFISVIAVEGKWDDNKRIAYDPYWAPFFNKDGLKVEKLVDFLREDGVQVVGQWTGSIIPNFRDKTGKNEYIEDMINSATKFTGFMININKDFEDSLDEDRILPPVDLTGHGYLNLDNSVEDYKNNINFLSYNTTTPMRDIRVHDVEMRYDGIDEDFSPCTDAFVMLQEGKQISSEGPIVKQPYALNVGDYVAVKTTVETPNGDERDVFKLSRITSKVWISKTTKEEDKLKFAPNNENRTYLLTLEEGQEIGSEEGFYLFNIEANSGDIQFEPYTNLNKEETAERLDEVIKVLEAKLKATSDEEEKAIIQKDIDEYKAQLKELGDRGEWEVIEGLITPNNSTVSVLRRDFNQIDGITAKFTNIKGLRLLDKHKPGYDETGSIVSIEEGVEKIYSMLIKDPGIKRGLTNKEMIEFRYIIDSMGGGLRPEMGGKRFLSRLALEKGKCTAILSAPSMKEFEASEDPYFCDYFISGREIKPSFDTAYIPKGGNNEIGKASNYFSLPSEENGAKFVGVFAPYLQYRVGGINKLVPPAADVANVLMRKHQGGDPYVISANRNGILSNSLINGVEYKFDTQDRFELEPMGINPIITRKGDIMIYGNKTAFQTVKSDFNHLHVRELLNTFEIETEAILEYFPFDYNNVTTQSSIMAMITPIYEAAKQSGALFEYDIEMVDPRSDEVIDDTVGIIKIGVEFNKGMEKIFQVFNLKKYNK